MQNRNDDKQPKKRRISTYELATLLEQQNMIAEHIIRMRRKMRVAESLKNSEK